MTLFWGFARLIYSFLFVRRTYIKVLWRSDPKETSPSTAKLFACVHFGLIMWLKGEFPTTYMSVWPNERLISWEEQNSVPAVCSETFCSRFHLKITNPLLLLLSCCQAPGSMRSVSSLASSGSSQTATRWLSVASRLRGAPSSTSSSRRSKFAR